MNRVAAAAMLLWLGFAAPAAPETGAERHIAILVDTSTSMKANDRQRYTMQLSQIVSDLLAAGDQLTVVRMGAGRCGAGASSALALRLDPADRGGFKQRLDAHTRFNTGTNYSAAIRTAIEALGQDPSTERMLLILADSGGLGSCSGVLTRDLIELRDSGATIAAVNLGGTSGAFDGNPAFDFTTAALDAEDMVEAVAEVYQRFLGAKQVQTGRVDGVIEFEIAPFVEEAFLVVASDGPRVELRPAAGNPPVEAIELDHHGGGRTVGVDGRDRVYRIAWLRRPRAGRFTFHLPGLSDRAGWMLLQDSSLGVRLRSSGPVVQGIDTTLEVELFDRSTGQRVADTSQIVDLEVTLDIDGQQVTFRDDGAGVDRQAGDGVLSAAARFDRVGREVLDIRLGSDFLDRNQALEIDVVEATWAVRVASPRQAPVAESVILAVELEALGAGELTPPERIDVLAGGGPIVGLRDDGEGADEHPGDLIYSGAWMPAVIGTVELDYVGAAGSAVTPARQALEVVGRLALGTASPVDLGVIESGSQALGRLALVGAEVLGVYEATLTSDFAADRSVLEIDLGNGWQQLSDSPTKLQLVQSGASSWPLRLRTGACPERCSPAEPFEILVAATGPDGASQRLVIPLRVEVVADTWLECWWPVLALIFGGATAGVVAYGFLSPSRFAPRLGFVMSPEEDLEEGFFHPIRAQRGCGRGFFRDARVYLHSDFRLSAKSRGAFVRLRADGSQVRIQPTSGVTVWRQTAGDEWRQLSAEETTARFGTVYKNSLGTLFFQLRNG